MGLGGKHLAKPTSIQERVYLDGTVLGDTRTTEVSSATSYWVSRNLPASGKAMLDSSLSSDNCEVLLYRFSGHGAGNYVTNFKFYLSGLNSVASDMTHFYYTSATFTNPSSFEDVDIYNATADWSTAETALPGSPNVGYLADYSSTTDPTFSEYIYFGVAVEAGKATGTASWTNRFMFQYT